MDEGPHQEDCFPAPPRLPPEWPEQLQANIKGSLPLHPFSFQPCWGAEEKEAAWAGFCDCGTTREGPPRSAEEADDEVALTSTTKDILRSSVGAGSSGQAHCWKSHASFPEQTRARELEKGWLTRAGQHNAAGQPLPLALST